MKENIEYSSRTVTADCGPVMLLLCRVFVSKQSYVCAHDYAHVKLINNEPLSTWGQPLNEGSTVALLIHLMKTETWLYCDQDISGPYL